MSVRSWSSRLWSSRIRKGTPIDGLTAKDFTLTEDGVPQTIRFCEHQQLPTTPS